MANCLFGVLSSSSTYDLVIWNNHFRNVHTGIQTWGSADPEEGFQTGRLIITDNIIEINATLTNPWPHGILLGGTAGSLKYTTKQAVVRKNVIRDVSLHSGITEGLRGMQLPAVSELIAENNIIDNTAKPWGMIVNYSNKKKFFNNQTSSGVIVYAYDFERRALQLEDLVGDITLYQK